MHNLKWIMYNFLI